MSHHADAAGGTLMQQRSASSAAGDRSGRVMLGDAEIYQATNEIHRGGVRKRLKPKVMAVLMQLVDAGGEVVTKSELLDRVWPNMAVTDRALTEAVHELRKALDDDAAKPRFVQTIPRRGYRIVATIRRQEQAGGGRTEEGGSPPRIAVTNFDSLSSDPEDRFICEGLCEELINSLGRNSQFEVLGRTSTFTAGLDDTDPVGIAARLGVSHLVTGTLRRNRKRIRVIAHLIEGATGTQIWSDAYDRTVDDLIAVQDEIARQIGTAIAPRVDAGAGQAWVSRYVPDVDAFREFSKGRYFWKQDNANPKKPMTHYARAMQIDPGFAGPYVGMVECFNTLGVFHMMPQEEAREASLRHAEQALFLEPDSAESLFAFAYTQFYMRWDWAAAEQGFRKCLSINPNHALANVFLALLMCPLQRVDEAHHYARTATELDPFSPFSWWMRALQCHYCRNFEESLSAAEQGLELRTEDVLFSWIRADSLVRLGRNEEGLKAVAVLEQLGAEYSMFYACASILYSMLGRDEDSKRVDARLRPALDDGAVDPFVGSLLDLGRGNADRAVRMLEQAERRHDATLWVTGCEPYFDELTDSGRFRELLGRLGLGAKHT